MRGHVPTPEPTVDLMVSRLFDGRHPAADDVILDPGCGDGPFIAGILRYCSRHGLDAPRLVGIELNPALVQAARRRFARNPTVEIHCADFLESQGPTANFVVGNPPYVSILQMNATEKRRFRARFASASGRFDLYMLFFEKALSLLAPGGRMAFVTPEKFAYVASAAPLRRILARQTIRELIFLDERTFPGHTTYPLVTLLDKQAADSAREALVVGRDGSDEAWSFPSDGKPWSKGHHAVDATTIPLASLCTRISCGIATGADQVFVRHRASVPPDVEPFCHETISGRQLGTDVADGAPAAPRGDDVIIVPYDGQGRLLSEAEITPIRQELSDADLRRLEARSCVQIGRRPWYRFHDNVPLSDILRPKILCKDITKEPSFWVDYEGTIVPRHSVYYLVPNSGVDVASLAGFLNSAHVRAWLAAHCHKAANGFLRVQSTVLKRLPVPAELFPAKPLHGMTTAPTGQTTVLQFQ